MFDHVTINVTDYEKSRTLYEQMLAPLGFLVRQEQKGVVTGFGLSSPTFWISRAGEGFPVSKHAHVALTCQSTHAVDAFYANALANGATDNGAPGLRPEYGTRYYAAYVRDLDGNNIEAVCRRIS